MRCLRNYSEHPQQVVTHFYSWNPGGWLYRDYSIISHYTIYLIIIIPIEKYELLHRYLNLAPEDYPNSEKLSDTCLSLPLYPALSHDEIDFLSSEMILRNQSKYTNK